MDGGARIVLQSPCEPVNTRHASHDLDSRRSPATANLPSRGHTVFPTAIGPVGIAWGADGLVAVQLPERDERATEERLARRAASTPAAPPPWVRRAIEAIEAHLAGHLTGFAGVRLDLEGVPTFHRRVYEALRQIEPGRTATYAELADRAGAPGEAREVGEAMRKNPLPIVIPCHRVVATGGVGGFSAHGGLATKARLLAIEGVDLDAARAAKPRRTRSRGPAQGPTLFDSL
jgi:methylated-DNA-[protein]-cysteine S-methyltransferase